MDGQDAGSTVRYLIRDRDGKYPALVDMMLADAGIKAGRSGVQMPDERDHPTVGADLPPGAAGKHAGVTAVLDAPTHTYATAGTYTVRLTVTGYGGSDTVVRTALIKVTTSPPPPPSCPDGTKLSFRWHYAVTGTSGSWSGTKTALCPSSLTLGPQAMAGDLKVSPGTTLSAGYDFTSPGNSATFSVTVNNPKVAGMCSLLWPSGALQHGSAHRGIGLEVPTAAGEPVPPAWNRFGGSMSSADWSTSTATRPDRFTFSVTRPGPPRQEHRTPPSVGHRLYWDSGEPAGPARRCPRESGCDAHRTRPDFNTDPEPAERRG
jgi:hypothetical protein